MDSITANAGMTKPSGGTTMQLVGFTAASLDAAIYGEGLLLAMEWRLGAIGADES